MSKPIADYVVVTPGMGYIGNGQLYDYLFGAGGVFIRAIRPGLDACAQVTHCEIRGLAPVEPFVHLNVPRVPRSIVADIFMRARSVCVENKSPREVLFYLICENLDGQGFMWRCVEPEQIAAAASVRPADPFDPACAAAIIELHSHHEMQGFWSGQDDADETGFKLYAVIGTIFSRPTLRVRAGVYGHFLEIDAGEIFEIPEGVNEEEQ